jgi:hypothetical protein
MSFRAAGVVLIVAFDRDGRRLVAGLRSTEDDAT